MLFKNDPFHAAIAVDDLNIFCILSYVEQSFVKNCEVEMQKRQMLLMMLIQIILAIMLYHPKRVDIPSVSKNHFKPLSEKRYLVVVTVKNRVSYVKLLAENLQWLNIQEHADVNVFYGESNEYGMNDLHQWFPFAEIHSIETKNPDDACRNAFEHFFHHHSHEVVINLDSDALLHPSWFSFLEKILDKSDGVLSLYNSAAPYHVSFACDELTCQKKCDGGSWNRDY